MTDVSCIKARILHLSLDLRETQQKLSTIKQEYHQQQSSLLKTLCQEYKSIIIHEMFVPLDYPCTEKYNKYIFYHFTLENDNKPVITSLAVTITDLEKQLKLSSTSSLVMIPPPGYLIQQAQDRLDHGYNWYDTSILYPNMQGLVAMDTSFIAIRT
jgi:hypothetical protein